MGKKEKKAESILKKADNLWRRGKEINALKVYKQLYLEFPETAARKTAEDKLLKKGISIETALISWTSKRMVKLENTILAYRDRKGVYPSGRAVKHPLDAWGNEIYTRLFPNKKDYDFIVFSNGPDEKKSTEDDMLIIHTITKSEKSAPKKNTGGAMSLDDLKSLRNNAETTSELTLSLDQLKGTAGSKDSDQGSQANELSLEQLRDFAKDN